MAFGLGFTDQSLFRRARIVNCKRRRLLSDHGAQFARADRLMSIPAMKFADVTGKVSAGASRQSLWRGLCIVNRQYNFVVPDATLPLPPPSYIRCNSSPARRDATRGWTVS